MTVTSEKESANSDQKISLRETMNIELVNIIWSPAAPLSVEGKCLNWLFLLYYFYELILFYWHKRQDINVSGSLKKFEGHIRVFELIIIYTVLFFMN